MPADLELLITETLAIIAFPFSHTTQSGSAKTVRFPFLVSLNEVQLKPSDRQNDVKNRHGDWCHARSQLSRSVL
ncbi:MAG: hypothetical protein EAZ79_07165 [Oscillatoriales cyanobacterium]|nr:MAG: hypothetical protein EAZ79_07165 [Oscillatoriales cyanobacterium]